MLASGVSAAANRAPSSRYQFIQVRNERALRSTAEGFADGVDGRSAAFAQDRICRLEYLAAAAFGQAIGGLRPCWRHFSRI